MFSDPQMEVLSKLYSVVYPSQPIVYLPRSYRKLQSVSIDGQLFCARQYVFAKCVIHPTRGSSTIIRTAFSDSSLCPAKIHHFALHSCSIEQSHECHINHGFAVVSWPLEHPQKHAFGKPYELWCSSVFSYRDELVP